MAIRGRNSGNGDRFNFIWFHITADGDSSHDHDMKRCLLFRRKTMKNQDSVLKSRDINLLTKVHIVKAVISPVVIYRCENWTIKKAECWRINDFELWFCRRLLRVPWTARSSNQKILKEINPEYSGRTDVETEAPILWPPDLKNQLIGKDSDAGKDWGQEEKGSTENEMLDAIVNSMDMSLSKLRKIVKDRKF